MPVGPKLAQTPVGREIATLALSCVRMENPMAILRAAHWRNSLAKVGLGVPLFAVHDLGMLAIADPRSAPIGVRPFVGKTAGPLAQAAPQLALWAETLREVAASEVVERARQWRLGDDLLAVLLLRVLGPIWERHLGPGRRAPTTQLPLDPEVYRDLEPELPQLFNPASSSPAIRRSTSSIIWCASGCASSPRSSRSISIRCACSACSAQRPAR